MSLLDILNVFDTLLNAVLKGGLIHEHPTAKQILIARDELEKKAAEEKQPAPTGLKVVDDKQTK